MLTVGHICNFNKGRCKIYLWDLNEVDISFEEHALEKNFIMVKDIVGLSSNGYSVVQFVVTRCWNAEFQAGSHGDGQIPWRWWRGSVLLHRLQRAWAGWGILDPSTGSLRVVSVSILPQINDCLLQERCKGWYPKWQLTFRKFSAIKHFVFNESLLSRSEWFMTGF